MTQFAPLVEVTARQRAEAALAKIVADQPRPISVPSSSTEYMRQYMRKYRAKKRKLTGRDR